MSLHSHLPLKSGTGLTFLFRIFSKDTMTRLLTSLRILRNRHGCTLPVEIFGFPDELNSLGEVREQIEALGGIEWRNIETEKVPGAWKQFQIVRRFPLRFPRAVELIFMDLSRKEKLSRARLFPPFSTSTRTTSP